MRFGRMFNAWADFRFWLVKRERRRPRILLLADRRGWAFDHSARHIARELREDFIFDIRYVRSRPNIRPKNYDLIYVFFWGEDYHHGSRFDPDRTIKEVSSHRWEDDPRYGPCTPAQMAEKFLGDAAVVLCTSKRLAQALAPHHARVFHTPNGIAPEQFKPIRERTGPMAIGWAGNIHDPVKGVHDILEPACGDRFRFLTAPGSVGHGGMNDFFNRLDVIAVASKHEGEPLPLLEAMAAGCFPVCTDVGIVPEVIRHGQNGLILGERTPEAFRSAFLWCEDHLPLVRTAGAENARWAAKERNWQACAQSFKQAFNEALKYARRPRFRNDDVSEDTPLALFQGFCAVFHKYGLQQVHGVTLRGRTNSAYQYGQDAAEYEDVPPISKIPNGRIRELSRDLRLEDRRDLVDYLRESPDEIALHGLYHTDYSVMTVAEQRDDMSAGLALLRELFPKKRVRYFIAPFNRTSKATYQVAAEFGLEVLAAEGVHLESQLQDLHLEPEAWHRYHHHRFYPQSLFRYYKLSTDLLDAALARNVAAKRAPELGHTDRPL